MNYIQTTGQVGQGATCQDEVHCAHEKKVIFVVGAFYTFLTMPYNLLYYVLQAQTKSSHRGDAESDSDPYTAHDGLHVGLLAYN